MRCLCLADGMRKQGCEKIIFFCHDLPGPLQVKISEAGFECWPVEKASAEVFDQVADAESVLQSIQDMKRSWVIVDHYQIDAVWEQALRQTGVRILVIDDLANRSHDCDVLLDQNLTGQLDEQGNSPRYQNLVPKSCQVLEGPAFALLRDEFRDSRQNLQRNFHDVNRIVVFYGGADQAKQTECALRALQELSDLKLSVDVIVGEANERAKDISQFCSEISNFSVHVASTDVAKLYAQADLGLMAGGTTNWERACVGLPAIVTTVADNQVGPSRALAERGLAVVFAKEEITIESLRELIRGFLRQPEMLAYWSVGLMKLVDGRGLERILRVLENPVPTLRAADFEDARTIFEWRNDPRVRGNALSSQALLYDEHERWLSKVLADENRMLLIAEIDAVPVAVLRYDIEDNVATVSIFLNPEKLGQGLGGAVLNAGDAYLFQFQERVTEIHATVISENTPSQKMFLRSGYSETHAAYKKLRVSS